MTYTVQEIMKKIEDEEVIEVTIDGIHFTEELCIMTDDSEQPKTILLQSTDKDFIVIDFIEDQNQYEAKAISNDVAEQLLQLFSDEDEA
ncbi:MAG: hypothetical protein ACI35O_03805 [Bacillaceae bacterium]